MYVLLQSHKDWRGWRTLQCPYAITPSSLAPAPPPAIPPHHVYPSSSLKTLLLPATTFTFSQSETSWQNRKLSLCRSDVTPVFKPGCRADGCVSLFNITKPHVCITAGVCVCVCVRACACSRACVRVGSADAGRDWNTCSAERRFVCRARLWTTVWP